METRYGLDGPGIKSRCGRGFLCLSRTTPMPVHAPHLRVGTEFCLELMWPGRSAYDQRLEMVCSYTSATPCSCTGMSWGDLGIYIIPFVRTPSSNIPKLATFELDELVSPPSSGHDSFITEARDVISIY